MKKRSNRLAFVLGILWLLMAGMVRADTTLPPFGVFTMLEGQGVEVCEACLKAFEGIASGPDGAGLSGCERNYDSEYGLSAPQWTDLPPLKHLSLLKQVMLFLMPVNPDFYGTGKSSMYEGTIYETDETFRRQITGELEDGRHAMAQTMVDIDNDGRSERVLKLRNGVCMSHGDALRIQYQPLVVLGDAQAIIDKSKTDLVMQNPRKRKEVPVGSIWERIYDVFQYKGQVYFDKWERDDHNTAIENLFVFRAVHNRVSTLCKYRYERRYQSQVQGEKP